MLNPDELLSPEESAQVDGALMTSKDRFSTRVAIYALRIMKQISAEQVIKLEAVGPLQLGEFLENDQAAQESMAAQSMEIDSNFKQFWSHIILSARKPLGAIAEANNTEMVNITTSQIISWFKAQSKAAVEDA